MANDSKKNKELKVEDVSEEVFKADLERAGYKNIDLAVTTFSEEILREISSENPNSSTDTTSGATGGTQHYTTKFIDDGKTELLIMLSVGVVGISAKEKEELEEVMEKENKEAEKQDKEHEKE